MSTSIRLPQRLLARVDARAKKLGLSRNQLLTNVIENGIAADETWSPEFLTTLSTAPTPDAARTLERSLLAVRRSRRNCHSAPKL